MSGSVNGNLTSGLDYFGAYDPLAGSVANLLNPTTYTMAQSTGGLTAPAQANLNAFMTGAFNSLNTTGANSFQSIQSTFTTWASWQEGFADKIAGIFQDIASKSAKAPSGFLSSIFS